MRNISQLHPTAQKKAMQLQNECKKQGIVIGISECLRTVAEQDALYAKGRTTGGSKVTNCQGKDFSSMHQWGVAFDFYLKMDVDGDGKTSDDAYNNATRLFNQVGAIGKKLGLEWGGGWKSPVDLPHFQLPDWGSTARLLKQQYGTPDKFMKTWKQSSPTLSSSVTKPKPTNTVTASKNPTEPAKAKDAKYSGTYIVTAKSGLRLRSGAGENRSIINVIPLNEKVTCYGYYTKSNGTIWLYVAYGKYTGFVSASYLKKTE